MIRQVPNTGSFGADAQLTHDTNDTMARATRILSLDMTVLFLRGARVGRVVPGASVSPHDNRSTRAV
jgi:hypothetical protein